MKPTNSNNTNPATRTIGEMQTKAASREQLGVLLYDRLFNQVAAGKHAGEDGTGAIPITAYFSTQPANDESTDNGTRKSCIKICFKLPDGEVICHEHCRHDPLED